MKFLDKLRFPYREDTAFSFVTACVFLVPLVFSIYSYENFESVKFSIFLMLTGIAGVSFFLNINLRDGQIKTNKFIAWFAWGFGLSAAISAIFAKDRIDAIFGFYYRYTNGIIFYVALVLFFVLVANLVNKEKLFFLFKTLVLDAFLVGLLACLEIFGWIVYPGLDYGGFFRGPSFLGNSNYSAMFMACVFPLALFFWHQAKTFKAKIYYALAIFVIFIASFVLASRGAILALVAALFFSTVIIALYKFPKKLLLTLVISSFVSIVIGGYVLGVTRPSTKNNIFSNPDINTITRIYAWRITLDEIKRQPWFGVGLGNYALFFERQRTAEFSSANGVFDDAHNLYLHLASTGGVPFLVFSLLIILTPFYFGLKRLAVKKELIDVALLASLVIWLVSVSFTPVPIPMFMLLVILLVGLLFDERENKIISVRKSKKVVAIILSFSLLLWGSVSFAAEHLLGVSIKLAGDKNYLLNCRLAQAAYKLNPTNGLALIYATSDLIESKSSSDLVTNYIGQLKKLHPLLASTYISSSNLFYSLFNSTHDPKYLASAANDIVEALKIDPLYSDRWGQLALYKYQQNDLIQSKTYVLKDLELNDKDFYAWVLLAKLYQLENNRLGVINALTKALEINPQVLQIKVILNISKQLKDVKKVPLNIAAQQS